VIELVNDKLNVRFPEVHEDARCSVGFQRTLRVPDDNQDYPLPAGLGNFPVLPVDDFEVPARWKEHGGGVLSDVSGGSDVDQLPGWAVPVRGEFVVKRPSVCERSHDNAGATHIDRVRRG
jgi:hypothetical protein